jgi:hypothetical protein
MSFGFLSNAAVNVVVQIPVQASAFYYLGRHPEVGLLNGGRISVYLKSRHIVAPFTFPPAMFSSSSFPTDSPTLVIFCVFDNHNLNGCKLVFCFFDCISLMVSGVECLFMCLLSHLQTFFGEMSKSFMCACTRARVCVHVYACACLCVCVCVCVYVCVQY